MLESRAKQHGRIIFKAVDRMDDQITRGVTDQQNPGSALWQDALIAHFLQQLYAGHFVTVVVTDDDEVVGLVLNMAEQRRRRRQGLQVIDAQTAQHALHGEAHVAAAINKQHLLLVQHQINPIRDLSILTGRN